jgi:2-dehydro-3-deoxyglucarate aldolase
VEIMMKAGFDWLTIDMEHSAITLAQAQQLIRIIDLSSVSPLVRVGENNSLIIKRVMDAGAQGVIVPMVNSAQEALLAVAAVKYPPWGKRGVGLARAQGYGLTFNQYREWVNKYSIVIVQIEHIDAVNNIDEILSIKGVDGSIVGPYDLSASMGYPGEFNRKDVKQAIDKYLAACAKLKKPAGFHVIPPQAGKLQEKIKQGFKFLGFSLDTLFIGAKLKAELEKIII